MRASAIFCQSQKVSGSHVVVKRGKCGMPRKTLQCNTRTEDLKGNAVKKNIRVEAVFFFLERVDEIDSGVRLVK
jgi:hypothetical protein